MRKPFKNKGKDLKITTFGFTLIELLGVIVIIGLLGMIIYPVINKTLQNNKEKIYREQIDALEKAAYNWSVTNLPNPISEDIILTFERLKQDGYIKEDELRDPRDNKPLEGCILVHWKTESNQYSFTYRDSCNTP